MDKVNRVLTEMLLSAKPWRVSDAVAIRCLKLIPTLAVSTAATDGMVLIYNPAFIEGLTDAEVEGLLIHEVCHVRFDHCKRLDDSGLLDKERANRAMDREINGMLRSIGTSLPSGALLPEELGMEPGLAWEEYYPHDAMPEQPKADSTSPDGQPGAAGSAGQSGTCSGGDKPGDEPAEGKPEGNDSAEKPADDPKAPAPSQSDDEKQDWQKAEGDGDNASEGEPEACENGSGAGNGQVAAGAHAAGSLAEVYAPELLEEQTPDEVAENVKDSAATGRLPDSMLPSKLGIGSKSEPLTAKGELVVCTDVRWQTVVVDMLATRVGGDRLTDWSRPSRRSVATGEYRPARPKHRAFKVALVLDVSGSCVSYFSRWQALAREMLEYLPEVTEVELFYHDTRVRGTGEWRRADGAEIEIASRGGGGTSHIPVLAEVERTDADIAVLFTDCETRWPEQFKVDCVTVQPPGSRGVCPFGKTVRIGSW
jgi:predicted metal-dependent peptidase